MAQKVLIQLTDDLDDKPIADGKGGTVTFAVDGTTYEIDLSNKNADTFRGVFQDYIAAGRKVSGSRGRRSATTKESDAKAIREWAKANGVDVTPRGRVPASVREQYEAAH